MPIIISNASPLIALNNINRLNLLKKLWKEIIIPDAVYKEVIEDGAGKKGVDRIYKVCQEWIKIVSVENIEEVNVLRSVLDEGEAEVIALGQELKANLLLLDNREPRLFAAGINLNIMGTIGIIKLAWKKGLITSPLKDLYSLRLKGFWISERLMAEIQKDFQK